MAYCKIYLTLSAVITCHVSANYEYERTKALNHLADITRLPWNGHYDDRTYEGASSEILPHYYDADEPSPSERVPIGNAKKEPSENKGLKKPISPVYSPFTNKDPIKYKGFILSQLGAAHCQEIKTKSIGKESEPRKGVTTCYKCKDPKTRSTYERCFYDDQPEESASASTKMESFLSAPVGFRYRRSNAGRSESDYGKLRNPYRFTDEYFTDATYDVPAAYENKGEKCDKIVKDSMVCMVCRDAKTNGKYEQCSYVKQPREKGYSYAESSFHGKAQEPRNDGVQQQRQTEDGSYPESSDIQASNRRQSSNPIAAEEPRRGYFYPREAYPEVVSTLSEQDEAQDTSSADCKLVQKDSKTCKICKDSKVGGTYEKCSYSYQPSDKLYKYSRSKSFGYPDKTLDSTRGLDRVAETSDESKNLDYPESSGSKREHAYPDRGPKVAGTEAASDFDSTSHGSSDYSGGYPKLEGLGNYGLTSDNDDPGSDEGEATPTAQDRARSASERYSENINADHCKKIQKDSMTCTVCKDPKTGNDFERCSYSYRPNDKLFSYSKSRSFGNTKGNDRSHGKAPQEDEQPASSEVERVPYENVPERAHETARVDETKSGDGTEGKTRADAGYFDTAKKKAEVEDFLQNFQKVDRSKCKKVMRDKMTCYQCTDEEGSQKEECIFVTGREPDKDQLAFHEIKEYQIDPTHRSYGPKSSNSTKTVDKRTAAALEPDVSASKNSYVRSEKSDNDYPDEEQPHATNKEEETKEAEPYDYTSETRSRYDKVLGLTLPAYMFTTSEHEAAFDEVVASSYDQR